MIPSTDVGDQNTATTVTTIDLLRHGQCEGGHCYRGSLDVALSQIGQQQMFQRLSLLSPQWQGIVSSPLVRCADFAKSVAEQYAIPLQIDDRFKEVGFGEWEGKHIDEVWRTQQALVEAWGNDPVTYSPPDGEPADRFVERVVRGFEAVVDTYSSKPLLLVSHGGVIRALLVHILSMPVITMNRLDVPFACLSRIQVIDSQGERYYRLLHHNITGSISSS
ncbi:hypothetical protein AB835_06220 [Candidatus Endobugula sertula]|uniref:Alpha-ribazole phosphatase n=1 Tax=Candidatus Endobugula sertula TaxID=62101 RepID=A0A1D2QQU9_9GAMM|nr:hypothetical protein AB835_06220 [Candidatus Endobugula sertula]